MKLPIGKMNPLMTKCPVGYDASYKAELKARQALTAAVKPVKIKVRKNEGMVF